MQLRRSLNIPQHPYRMIVAASAFSIVAFNTKSGIGLVESAKIFYSNKYSYQIQEAPGKVSFEVINTETL